jgi:hypothetical protein
MKYKICKIIAASQLEEHTREGWFIEESFFQDEPALGSGSSTLAGTDQYGNQQWNVGEAPVVALSRRFYVISRTEEVDRAERIEEQKKHIEFLEKSNNDLRAEVEKAESAKRQQEDICNRVREHRDKLSAANETSERTLHRIKQALGQERFDELVSDK